MKAQKVNPVSQRENLGFLIELQPQTGHESPDFFEAKLQVFFVRVDEEKVIHITAIPADAEPLFDKVVKFIQKQQGKKLAGLIAQRQPVRAVYVGTQQIIDNGLKVQLFELFLEPVMVDGRKEMPHICLEDPALRCAVFVPVFCEKALEPVQPKVQAFSSLGCVVVKNETSCDAFIYEVIHQSVLDHFVNESRSLHKPLFGLIDIEHPEQPRAVNLGLQDIDKVDDIGQQVDLIMCGSGSGAFAPSGRKVGFVKHRKGANLGKFKHGFHTPNIRAAPCSSRRASLSLCAV